MFAFHWNEFFRNEHKSSRENEAKLVDTLK